MSIVTTDNRFYSEIAAAIREKNGESTLYLPADMAEAILAIKGGGDAYAAISVTYPEGSVCTCTQPGQAPLTAGDTSGAWLFVVPVGGEWRIRSQNSSTGESAFRDIEITDEYQVEQIELSYKAWLYNHGDLCGYDWKICRHNNGYATPEGDEMYYTSSSSGARVANGFFVNEKIDLTNFSELSAEILEVVPTSDAWIFITDSVQTSNQIYYYLASNVSKIISKQQITNTGEFVLDVGELYGEFYINIGSRATAANARSTLKVDAVWLE